MFLRRDVTRAEAQTPQICGHATTLIMNLGYFQTKWCRLYVILKMPNSTFPNSCAELQIVHCKADGELGKWLWESGKHGVQAKYLEHLLMDGQVTWNCRSNMTCG